ncbi:MFS transporter [Streptomyces hainanensis]|uniref:MFS transporter n=1 Tax=Streptomyces hainanensis TaxID=402648 RepID=A0A4V2Y497_9ACTN|nr:MFS transporter [Streptomyces hainanensis]TDC79575.1 MFS transporter [Streptomyces hainanensis]
MRLLRNTRFRRLLIGETLSSFGDSAMYLSLAIWAKDLTGSDAAAGMIFLFLTVPALGAPLMGYVVDRVNRKPLLMWLYGGMALLVLSLLTVRTADQLWILYLVALGYGFLFATPARNALLKDLLPSTDAVEARSLLITARESVRIVSPAIGAGVYVAWGGGVLAVLDALTFGVAILLLASIRVTETRPISSGEGFRTQAAAGFRHVHQVPLLFHLVLTMIGYMLFAGLLESASFAAIDEGLGQAAAFFGVSASVQGAGSVLGGLLAGPLVRRLGESGSSGVGYAVVATGMGLCVTGELPLFLAGVALNGIGMPILAVALGTATHLYTPSRMQGRVNAAVTMVTNGGQALSIAAGAALIGLVDYRVMYVLMALAAVTGAVVVLFRPPPVPDVVPSVADEDTGQPVADDASEPTR